MKYYKGKESGAIYNENEVDKNLPSDYEQITGEANKEYNIMQSERHLNTIRTYLGWILFLIVASIAIQLISYIMTVI